MFISNNTSYKKNQFQFGFCSSYLLGPLAMIVIDKWQSTYKNWVLRLNLISTFYYVLLSARRSA